MLQIALMGTAFSENGKLFAYSCHLAAQVSTLLSPAAHSCRFSCGYLPAMLVSGMSG